MTESEWLINADPEMLFRSGHIELSDRQQYLFAVAVCRRIRGLLIDSNSLRSLDVIEAFADGNASPDDLRRAGDTAVVNWDEFDDGTAFDDAQRHAVQAIIETATRDDPAWWALHWATQAVERRGTVGTVRPAFACILRDIVGNPFRPVVFSREWRTTTAILLARQMYETREFSAMPILADALQDAGCDIDGILDHLRGDEPHCRGCWVLDLVLGNS